MDLSEVSTDSLMKEMQRRLDCMNKPEKRLILVGATADPDASIGTLGLEKRDLARSLRRRLVALLLYHVIHDETMNHKHATRCDDRTQLWATDTHVAHKHVFVTAAAISQLCSKWSNGLFGAINVQAPPALARAPSLPRSRALDYPPLTLCKTIDQLESPRPRVADQGLLMTVQSSNACIARWVTTLISSASVLCGQNEHCLCHLATGDMLRAAVAAKTKLGREMGRSAWIIDWGFCVLISLSAVVHGGSVLCNQPFEHSRYVPHVVAPSHLSAVQCAVQAKAAMESGALVSDDLVSDCELQSSNVASIASSGGYHQRCGEGPRVPQRVHPGRLPPHGGAGAEAGPNARGEGCQDRQGAPTDTNQKGIRRGSGGGQKGVKIDKVRPLIPTRRGSGG
eukprot:1195758-Prorocentrum_minimum.AAC.4